MSGIPEGSVTTSADHSSPAGPGSLHHGPDVRSQKLKHKTPNDQSRKHPCLRALQNFDSRWFLIPQGTGSLSIAVLGLPFLSVTVRQTIADVFWGLTIVPFLIILFIYVCRIIKFRRPFPQWLFSDNTELSCLASIAVTITTITQTLGSILGPWGWAIAVHRLWWVSAGLSFAAVIIILYVFAHINPPSIAQLLPNTQLPLVAAITAAAAGGSICSEGYLSAEQQVPMILASYLLLGIAMPLVLILDALFLSRLYNETKEGKTQETKSNAMNLAYQSLVLVGPWSQANCALQRLGKSAMQGSFGPYNRGIMLTSQAAPVVGYSSMMLGLCFWGQATFWWLFALVSIAHAAVADSNTRGSVKFDLAAWSLVFPWVSCNPEKQYFYVCQTNHHIT